MSRQKIENLRGEVEFRRKLFQQQVEGVEVFEDEFDAAGIEAVLLDRMAQTFKDLSALRAGGIDMSPYVEIGAERGQRALVLENDFACEGAAVDISFDLLKSCEHYRARLGRERMPLRICADANRLPFASGSIPFVFCYQTLHHFPDPRPIVDEVYRILSPGGYFFFAEEPYRRMLHWNLYTVKGGVCSDSRGGPLRRLVRRFFAREVVNEEQFGVIENHDIPLAIWKDALSRFEDVEMTLLSMRRRVDLHRSPDLLSYALAYLMGGAISGLARKPGGAGAHASSIRDALVSPALLERGKEVRLSDRGPVYVTDGRGVAFPVVDGVAFLLTPETGRELYPEIFTAGTAG